MTIQARFATALAGLTQWFSENSLLLNLEKTNCMRFHTRQNLTSTPLSINSGHVGISSVNQSKFLGLHIRDTLEWDWHCDQLAAKLNSCCYAIHNMRDSVGRETLLLVYHAMVGSRLNYAVALWGSSHSAERIFRIQKRIIRCICRVPQTESCRDIFRQLGILTLPSMCILELLLYTHSRQEQLVYAHEIHSHNTRHKERITLPLPRLDLYKRSPEYLGRVLYNALPQNLRTLNEKSFKRKVKHILVEQCFYNREEYSQYFAEITGFLRDNM